jgi:general secretion pathway protein I
MYKCVNKLMKVIIDKPRILGFTLLEILVALAIFAMVSISCYRQVDVSFRAITRIEQKYIALWIAESKLEELFVERKYPLAGETKSDYEVLDSQWHIKMRISETDIEKLRVAEVSVYASDDSDEKPILTLTRFVGEN